MARKAREKRTDGTYYVTQQSSGCRPLFLTDGDRTYFIELLQRAVNMFNCHIIEYCVQENDTYHLIIDVNGGDLSKIMKTINIPYGMHATCDGKLFKDRYRSQVIEDETSLESIRVMIRNATSQEGGFSSFCVSEIKPYATQPMICIDCIGSVEDAVDYLSYRVKSMGITLDEAISDKGVRNQLMKEIRRTSTLSLKRIGEVFGGISESSVSKIIKQP